MDTSQVAARVSELACRFAGEREVRRQRRHLERADFERLHEAGFTRVGLPAERGGLWSDVRRSTRPVCEMLRVLARGDPSVALVASMHPAVLAYWLCSPEVPEAHRDAWRDQRDAIFNGVEGGAWWGTITSEPGSGGDILKTRTVAVAGDAPGSWRISGDKHFASGSGISSFMVTTARAEGDPLPDLFFLDLAGVPWDGSTGMKLVAEWDGHGMAATQSHAFRFDGFPATRVACPITELAGMADAACFYQCAFTAVVLGVVQTAVAAAREKLAPRAEALRPYEKVEWTRVGNQAWLAEQAYEGMLRAVENGTGAALATLRGKTVVAELAESALGRLSRVLGGASFSQSQPFGTWAEDVRALGFLRPPWGLAFDQLRALDPPS